jgi:hypothetical protein
MNDFSIRIENLPDPDSYSGNEFILKLQIWYQIMKVLHMQLIND